MKFVLKKSLKEEAANPLNNINDNSADKKYVQAILNAIGSEADANMEYNQILDLEKDISDKELVNIFHDTLIDIAGEETKHLAQLNTQLSKVPEYKEKYLDGVEEAESGKDNENTEEKDSIKKESVLSESVNKNRKYSPDELYDVIIKNLDLTPDQYDYIAYDIINIDSEDILDSEQVNLILENIINYLNPGDEINDIRLRLEDNFNKTRDPEVENKKEKIEEIEYDIETIEDIIQNLHDEEIIKRLYSIIEEFEAKKNVLKVELDINTSTLE